MVQEKGVEAYQKYLMQKASDNGEKITPVQAKQQAEKMGRAASTLAAMEKIRNFGGKANYLTAELTDLKSVEAAVDAILQEEGRVDVLIHAAGIERSRNLDRKTLDEFTTTIEVKATGFFYLFKALQDHHNLPKTAILFSSIAGRFGNLGQTDYSAANDLLAKLSSSLTRQYPGMRVATLDWGPWAEVGMASRGAIPRLMSMAGIEMMSPDEAAQKVYQEITQGKGHEAIYAGSLGALAEQAGKAQPLDIEAANHALRTGDPIHIMLSSVTGFDPENGVVLEVELDPEKEPFLHDHSLNGTPLLPGVMGIEGFSVAAQHIASVLGAGDDYSFRVSRLEDVQFIRGFKFYRNEPRHIIWKAQPLREDTGLIVSITLESRRPARLGEGNTRLHFSGKVHLQPTQQPLQSVADAAPKWNGGYTLADKDIYKLYFHGPAFQVLEGVQREGSHIIGKLRKDLPPFTSRPVNLDTTPLLIELCLQTAGIWETGMTGTMSLPHTIGKVTLYRHVTNGVPVFARVKPRQTENGFSFNSQVIDAKGRVYLELENYRTVNLPRPIDKPLLAPLEKLLDN
jgi:NADP-dependent 3-hydroxy acid dehydrogenase YdfG